MCIIAPTDGKRGEIEGLALSCGHVLVVGLDGLLQGGEAHRKGFQQQMRLRPERERSGT